MMQLELAPYFDGETFDEELDGKRLGKQLKRVFLFFSSGDWFSLAELSQLTGAPESSVSARIRDLRKPRFGGHTVERRRRTVGTWEYRMVS